MENQKYTPCQVTAIFLGGALLSTEHHEMPHGSFSDVTVEKWRVPKGYPMDLRMSANLGYFEYDRDWNCFMQAWEAFRDKTFENIHDQIIHSDAKDTISRMIAYRGISSAFHYLHIYIKWVMSGIPPTDKELSRHKSPD